MGGSPGPPKLTANGQSMGERRGHSIPVADGRPRHTGVAKSPRKSVTEQAVRGERGRCIDYPVVRANLLSIPKAARLKLTRVGLHCVVLASVLG